MRIFGFTSSVVWKKIHFPGNADNLEEKKNVQSQTTFATLVKTTDGYDLKIVKQKVMVQSFFV